METAYRRMLELAREGRLVIVKPLPDGEEGVKVQFSPPLTPHQTLAYRSPAPGSDPKHWRLAFLFAWMDTAGMFP